MLRSQISTTETILGHRIPEAALSMSGPDEGSHYGSPVADIVRKAFSLVGLGYTQIIAYSYYGEPLLYPENSIMAAHNLGLCHPYNVSSEYCLGPGRRDRLGREQDYMVGYYTDALEVILTSPTALAYSVTPYPYADYELGENMRQQNPDESFYWEQVRHLLSTPLLRHVWKPTRVVMYGDRSNDTQMQQLSKGVLKAFLADEEQPDWVKDKVNPVFAGAMGAAEFTKRELFWNKEKPISELASPPKVYL
ncbi:unnamed protein product [Cercospora beticola]|nr:unnamed protein product [Cercospora beticola]